MSNPSADESLSAHTVSAHTRFEDSFSYASYLHLPQLLSARSPLTQAHDEVLFIAIHHVQEVWMSLIVHELQAAMQALQNGQFEPAMKMLARVARAQEQMGGAWEVLKTMTPADYLEFRYAFGKASGFQSAQYRSIEFLLGNRQRYMLKPFAQEPETHARLSEILASPSLYDLALRALVEQGLLAQKDLRERYDTVPEASEAVLAAWLQVYRDTASHWHLYDLAEKLVDVEDNFRRWRFNHVTTVERLIGHKVGSGGTSGVGYLKQALDIVLFPELWQVRTHL